MPENKNKREAEELQGIGSSNSENVRATVCQDERRKNNDDTKEIRSRETNYQKRKSWREMRRELEGIQKIMSEAAAKVIGAAIPVDIKFIRSQYKQDTENQKLWDKLYEKVLKVKGGRNSYQYRTELNSVVDGKAAPVS